jgi:hypothetical protein
MLRSRQFWIVLVRFIVVVLVLRILFFSIPFISDDDAGFSPLLFVSTNSDDNSNGDNNKNNSNDMNNNMNNDQKKEEVEVEKAEVEKDDNNEYKHNYRWRKWLLERQEQRQKSNDTVITIDKVKPISLHADWGCGFSMQVYFETPKIASSTIAGTNSTSTSTSTSTTTETTTETPIKAFFKSSYADMSHYDAESHLREIKAYYLDQILKTYVVLPCVGYQFSSQQLQQHQQDNNNNDKKKTTKKMLDIINDNLDCTRENEEGNSNDNHHQQQQQQDKTNSTIIVAAEGSIMLWLDGIDSVSKESIVRQARAFNITSSNNNNNNAGMTAEQLQERREQQQKQISAINYAIFHYLGACMKSEHNHFRYNSNNHNKNKNEKNSNHHDQPSSLFLNNDDEQEDGDGSSSINNRYYTAIDNDRCMTPKSIYSNTDIVPKMHLNRIELWKNLVFGRICDYASFNNELNYNHHYYYYQLPVLQVVQEAAASASASHNNNSNSNSLISNRLIEALKDDVLSYELIMSQPEAFTEIDDRINKLGRYIREKCGLKKRKKN